MNCSEYNCAMHLANFGATFASCSLECMWPPSLCPLKHYICRLCISLYVFSEFSMKTILNSYECPACAARGIRNSVLFIDSAHQIGWLRYIIGEKPINLLRTKIQYSNHSVEQVSCKPCGTRHNRDLREKHLIICDCGNTLCGACGLVDHHPLSCLQASIGPVNYQIIELGRTTTPPEYQDARRTLGNSPKLDIERISLIINKRLTHNYLRKRNELNGNAIEEVVYHGTNDKNCLLIAKTGFKIGGISKGVPLKTGKTLGYGIYTTLDPAVAKNYTNGSKFLLCCLGIRARTSTVPAHTRKSLTTSECDSFYDGNSVIVYWSASQLLPKYLIQLT